VFFPGPPFSFTNKTDCHDKTEILLKVALKHHNTKYVSSSHSEPVKFF
jgi:hypothetical protein